MKLARDALAKSTRTQYNKHFVHWQKFCDWKSISFLKVSENNLLDFIAWCFKFTDLNSNGCDKAITAAISNLKDNGHSFDRSKYKTIKRLLDGYEANRPPDRRFKKPFSAIHVQQMFKFSDTEDFNTFTLVTATLFAYVFLLRPGEFTINSIKKKSATINQVTFIPTRNSKEMTFRVLDSKTNKKNKKNEIRDTPCLCNDKTHKNTTPIPCPVHTLKKYLSMRESNFGKCQSKDPLFVTKDNTPLRYHHLNNFLFNVISMINRKRNVSMKPTEYTPHALRVGGCTDMARNNEPNWKIERLGRWSQSKTWRDVYINLDWTDLAILLNRPQSQLMAVIKSQPFMN